MAVTRRLAMLSGKSIVFVPARTSQSTLAVVNTGAALLVFHKDGPENALKAWRVTAGSKGSTPHSQPIKLSGDTVRLRPGFQAVSAEGCVYLLGGCNPQEQRQPDFIDVMRVHLQGATDTSGHVECVQCTGTRPSPRRDFATAVHNSGIYTFGGQAVVPVAPRKNGMAGSVYNSGSCDLQCSSGDLLGEPGSLQYEARFRDSDGLYRLDLWDNSWTLVKGQCIEGVDEDEGAPGPRAGCLHVQDGHKLWLLGGHRVEPGGESSDLRSQVYCLDLNEQQWTRVHTQGRTPDPRNLYNASALLWRGGIYVLGTRQCHRLGLEDQSWALLPGVLSTRGRRLLTCTWLHAPDASTGDSSDVLIGIMEALGPAQGEPLPSDPGSLHWNLYRLVLHRDDAKCTASSTYTAEQQPAANKLLLARAHEEDAFLQWEQQLKQQEQGEDGRMRGQLPVKVMSFGDFKGQLVWELPADYIQWMAQQPGFFQNRRALLYSLKQLGMVRYCTDARGRRVELLGLVSTKSLDRRLDRQGSNGGAA